MNQKQISHLREMTLKFYGKIIGNVAWNLLLLLYQSGSMQSQKNAGDKSCGRETKMLIKSMATKKRTASCDPITETVSSTT